MSKINAIIGLQWGDEGKGKWVDILSKDMDIVARFQGGNNAGHTIYVDNNKFILHHLPSAILKKNKLCLLSAGMVLNPVELVKEIKSVEDFRGKLNKNELCISPKVHIISPWHILKDIEFEKNKPIGTTKKGIGPTYSDKSLRCGLRFSDFINPINRLKWFKQMGSLYADFDKYKNQNTQIWKDFIDSADILAEFLCDSESKIRKSSAKDLNILFEGAQGTMLDIDHGTYPFVTSNHTTSNGIYSSIGLDPKKINSYIGVAKAYVTRVGDGPMPTELKGDMGNYLARKGNEIGATTGRARRCGWLDLVALKYATEINHIDSLIINKFDILSNLKNVKLSFKYKYKSSYITDFPWDINILNNCKPVYKDFKGWGDIIKKGNMQDLPNNALDYIKYIEDHLQIKVDMIGTGVNSDDALY